MAEEALGVAKRRTKLAEVAALFLRLGFTAFGGPAAHIAMMENEVVRRRRWVSSERFLDLLGAANLIPGPSSTELAILIGYEQAGWLGLVLGGACFILPAAAVVMVLAWAYVRFGSLPSIAGILYGIKPVVIVVVARALWALAPKAIERSRWLAAIGGAACAASALHLDAMVVLVGAGVASATLRHRGKGDGGAKVLLLGSFGSAGAVAAVPISLLALFLSFLKIGAVVFGSGYVLLAFLRADLVDRLHWLTERQLLDAVVIGQITPGPVFTTATFIGYVIGGWWGALLATVGIFLPGFLFVAMSRPLLARVRQSAVAAAFLAGVNVAALALMAVVTVQLALAALVDTPAILIAIVAAFLLVRWEVSLTWLVAGAALVGALSRRLP